MLKLRKLWHLALVTAVTANIVGFALMCVLGLCSTNEWYYILICFMASIFITYLAISNIIKAYVYSKIKPIYKYIRKAKLGRKELRNEDMNNDIIERVEDDVRVWVQDTEAEMKDIQSMEEYRREYIGNISHELKTPIFNMQGYLHSLLEGAMYDKRFLKSFLEKAVSNVDRLSTIVQDLDLISKIESGTIELDIKTFILVDLVEEVISDIKDLTKIKNIKFIIKENTGKSIKVIADREAILQVLINLFTNSIKYGKQNGITKIGFYDMDKYVLVEVTDNGLGIDSEHLSHLFDRFYRVEKSRVREKSGEGGSGLGLSIVKHLIDAHDQTISVRSTPGIGSTFGFTLKKG